MMGSLFGSSVMAHYFIYTYIILKIFKTTLYLLNNRTRNLISVPGNKKVFLRSIKEHQKCIKSVSIECEK